MKPPLFSQPRRLAEAGIPARRFLPREERHPNAVTAPPIHRGSMAPQPWRGFWNSLGAALVAKVGIAAAYPARGPRQAWERAAQRRRLVFTFLTLLSTALAAVLFARVQPHYDSLWLEYGQIALYSVLSGWVVTGFVTALMGFWVSLRGDPHALSAKQVAGHSINPEARTAIIMPICNEDVATVFAGLRATCESVAGAGQARHFDVFVLSDSNQPERIAAERAAWEALRAVLAEHPSQPQVEVYYRLRTRRTHRKAGNVADFCRRWGKDYRYMVVLDADSVMSGDCLATMVKLMEVNPTAGIIQTATQAIGHVTLHARAQQFASRLTGRLFTLGMQFWQLGESHYWGHNAIIRVEPFMKHCALAPIRGKGGMSGGILSHDFVEASLMRRAGYHVWLIADLSGSYEQQPPHLLAELQRDRRWCQGNLQNARLMAEPGIHPVHRMMFITGTMAYISAPLWLAFLTLGTALWLHDSLQGLLAGAMGAMSDSFEGTLSEAISESLTQLNPFTLLSRLPTELVCLWLWTLCILFLPRALGVLAIVMRGDRAKFGGLRTLLKSSLLESTLAIVQAPVRMLAHSLFVLTAVTGLKLDWKSPPRDAAAVRWRDAVAMLAPMTGLVALLAVCIAAIDARALVWLMPVGLPLLLAIPLTVATSQTGLGSKLRDHNFLLIPEESRSPAVLRRAWMHADRLARAPRLAAA